MNRVDFTTVYTEKEVEIKGVTVYVDTRNNRVYKMSDWSRCWELAAEGYLIAQTYRHLWGHTDFFLVKK